MGLKLKNNAFTFIPALVNSGQTVITVASGTGSKFPVLSTNDYFYATLSDVNNNYEIIKVTARADDVFMVDRGQENTGARTFPPNSRIELRVTVGNVLASLNDLNFVLL